MRPTTSEPYPYQWLHQMDREEVDMAQDMRHWLAEIKALQQKIVELQQERDEAYRSASNWRSLYDTEARQRREEATQAQRSLSQLQAEVQQLRAQRFGMSGVNGVARDGAGIESNATRLPEALQDLNTQELQALLVRALTECDRLQQELEAERTDHIETRQSLMSALGDTVDVLTRERLALHEASSSALVKQSDSASPEP